MDHCIGFIGQFAGQQSQKPIDDFDGCLSTPYQSHDTNDHQNGHDKKNDTGVDHPGRQVIQKKNNNSDGQYRDAVEHSFYNDCAERCGHFNRTFFRDQIGSGQFADAGRNRSNSKKTDTGYGKKSELINLFYWL